MQVSLKTNIPTTGALPGGTGARMPNSVVLEQALPQFQSAQDNMQSLANGVRMPWQMLVSSAKSAADAGVSALKLGLPKTDASINQANAALELIALVDQSMSAKFYGAGKAVAADASAALAALADQVQADFPG